MTSVASSEGEIGALEQILDASDDVIDRNVYEDQELLVDGDIFADRYTLDQVFLIEQLIEIYCTDLKLGSPNRGILEAQLVKHIGDNELLPPPPDKGVKNLQQRSQIAVALLSIVRTSCDSLHSVEEHAISSNEQDKNELYELDKFNKERARELTENGFVSVDDGEIADWGSLLVLSEPFLVDKETVSEKLRFEPTSFIEQEGLEYIGSEAIGAIREGGFDSVVSLYRTVFGTVSITEIDVSGYEISDTDYVTQSYFETNTVGETEVLSFVMRGQTTDAFETQYVWADDELNREYTISVNINTNDPASSSHVDSLLEIVGKISD
jgi:hypothetical protein